MTRDLVDMMGGARGRPPMREDAPDTDRDAPCTFDLVVLYDGQPDAIKFSDTGEDKDHVWLPRKFCDVRSDGRTSTGTSRDGSIQTYPVVSVTIPQWLAKEKGLI